MVKKYREACTVVQHFVLLRVSAFIFWKQICSEKEEHLIIDGECYCLGTPVLSTKPSSRLGHGGRRFTIRTFDGELIETNNLWCNGTVPPEFKDQLPDNATFVYLTDNTPCDY